MENKLGISEEIRYLLGIEKRVQDGRGSNGMREGEKRWKREQKDGAGSSGQWDGRVRKWMRDGGTKDSRDIRGSVGMNDGVGKELLELV